MARFFLWYYKSFLCGQLGVAGTQPTVMTAATPSASGGTLVTNVYYYRVTAIVGGVESVGSNEFTSSVQGPSGSVVLTWLAVPSATNYNVYRGTASGNESAVYNLGNVTTYTDTNAAAGAGSPPTAKGTWWVVGSSNGTNADVFSTAAGLSYGHDYMAVNNTVGPTYLTLPISWNSSAAPSTNFNRNTVGNAHTWYVLRAPASISGASAKSYYLLIDWSTANDYTITITLGVDTPPTVGSNTTAPTMNCVVNGVTQTVAGSILTATNFSMSASIGPVHINSTLATDGSFNILTSRDGTGKFISGFMAHLPANLKAVENYPLWIQLGGDTTVTTGFGATSTIDNAGSCIMRAPDGTLGGNWAAILPVTTYVPNVADSFDGSFIDWPIWLGSANATYRSIRGRLQDIMFLGAGVVATGSVDNPAGTPAFMVVGSYWFPTNVAPIL